MKLAIVRHNRCDEIQASTYVWVPDDWAQSRFEQAVDDAEKRYAADTQEYLDAVAVTPAKFTGYNREHRMKQLDPNLTLAAANAQLDAEDESEKVRRASLDKRYKGFSDYLVEQGCTKFYDGLNPDSALETEVYWGHQHGTRLHYEDTKMPDDLKVGFRVRDKNGDDHYESAYKTMPEPMGT